MKAETKRSITMLFAVALFFMLLLAPVPSQAATPAAAPIVIRLATTVQASMPSGAAMKHFCELVTQRSNGKFKAEFYPARQLGESDEIMAQVVNGNLEFAQVSMGSFTAFTPLLEVMQLPFLLPSYEKLMKATDSDEMRAIFAQVEKVVGLKILAVTEHGMRHIANNVRPIHVPSDFAGLKLRITTTDSMFESIRAFGGSPISLPYGQVYSGMQGKVIDGEEINYTSVYAEKHYEVIKYFTDMSIWPFPSPLIMSDKFYKSLTAEEQKMFRDIAAECYAYNMREIEAYSKVAYDTMVKNNVAINTIEDMAPFHKAVSPIIQKYKNMDPLMKNFIEMAEKL